MSGIATDADTSCNKGKPPPEQLQFSHEAVSEEIKIIDRTEVESGFVECENAVIYVDNKKIDLFKFSPEIVSQLLSNGSSCEAEMQNDVRPTSIEKLLIKNNNPFLNYVGQSLIYDILGKDYQAVPFQFCIYGENGSCPPRQITHEENVFRFMILVCPTNCDGGEVNFPEFKQKFSGDAGKIFTYAIFDIERFYEVLKVIKGVRVLVTYKIFKNQLRMGKGKLVEDTEKLKKLLEDIKDENTLIPITKGNLTQKVCDEANIKYELVFGKRKNPKRVYNEIYKIEDDEELFNESFVHFKDVIGGSTFVVGTRINLSDPEIVTQPYKDGLIYYHAFILINPREKVYVYRCNLDDYSDYDDDGDDDTDYDDC